MNSAALGPCRTKCTERLLPRSSYSQ